MARAFVFPYNGCRVDGGDVVMAMPVTFVADNGDTFGPTIDVRVPLTATPQQIRAAILAEVSVQGALVNCVITQNETILMGYEKG